MTGILIKVKILHTGNRLLFKWVIHPKGKQKYKSTGYFLFLSSFRLKIYIQSSYSDVHAYQVL